MNVKLLRKVKRHILAEPKRWTFEWLRHTSESPCGTQACIGGWTEILGDPKNKQLLAEERRSDHAGRLLGIDAFQRYRLFIGWPEKFHVARYEARTKKVAAKVAAARIEHFIKTKGRE